MGVASLGDLRDGGATWVGEAEDFGNFVKTFTDGIISSGANNFEMIMFS